MSLDKEKSFLDSTSVRANWIFFSNFFRGELGCSSCHFIEFFDFLLLRSDHGSGSLAAKCLFISSLPSLICLSYIYIRCHALLTLFLIYFLKIFLSTKSYIYQFFPINLCIVYSCLHLCSPVLPNSK